MSMKRKINTKTVRSNVRLSFCNTIKNGLPIYATARMHLETIILSLKKPATDSVLYGSAYITFNNRGH